MPDVVKCGHCDNGTRPLSARMQLTLDALREYGPCTTAVLAAVVGVEGFTCAQRLYRLERFNLARRQPEKRRQLVWEAVSYRSSGRVS